jgi:hypothetical protein
LNRNFLAVLMLFAVISCGHETTTAESSPAQSETTPVTETSSATETSSHPTGEPAASAGGPCTLITEEDASQVMAHDMKFGTANSASECLLISAKGDTTKSLSFQVVPGSSMYDQMAAGGQPLGGIGEKAATVGNLVVALKNNRTYLGGIYDGASPSTMGQKSVDLAKKIVPRM